MRIAILGAATLALAACNQDAGPAGEPAESPPPAAPAVPSPPASLEPLGEADISGAALEGELACSFRREEGEGQGGGEAMLFLGRGDVSDEAGAAAVVRHGGQVIRLTMDGTGGYDAMADGARFTGAGLALAIAPDGGDALPEDPQVAMESPIHRATLTFTPKGAPEQTIAGLYECGP